MKRSILIFFLYVTVCFLYDRMQSRETDTGD